MESTLNYSTHYYFLGVREGCGKEGRKEGRREGGREGGRGREREKDKEGQAGRKGNRGKAGDEKGDRVLHNVYIICGRIHQITLPQNHMTTKSHDQGYDITCHWSFLIHHHQSCICTCHNFHPSTYNLPPITSQLSSLPRELENSDSVSLWMAEVQQVGRGRDGGRGGRLEGGGGREGEAER